MVEKGAAPWFNQSAARCFQNKAVLVPAVVAFLPDQPPPKREGSPLRITINVSARGHMTTPQQWTKLRPVGRVCDYDVALAQQVPGQTNRGVTEY